MPFERPADDLVHRLPVRAGYGDTDQSGVVHHAVYLRWLEDGRTAYLREAGCDFVDLERRRRVGLAVARAELRYVRPAHFDEELTIETWLGEKRNASFRFDYRVMHGNELLMEASITLACIDLERMRAIRIPEELRTDRPIVRA
jgi:acyl-CoA thioester hydrolase